MPQHYEPGSRKGFNQNRQLSENRYAWVTVEAGKFLILVGDEDAPAGADVILYHPTPGRLPDISIGLTSLTEPELEALKELFDAAFAWALPVVQQRDKEAQDAYESGDDSYVRYYRAVPQLVFRKRPRNQHGQGVQQRPQGVPEGGGRGRTDHDGGVRGAGDELAEPDSGTRLPQDDEPQGD